MLKESIPSSDSDHDALISRNACESYCIGDIHCWGCSVSCSGCVDTHCTGLCQWNAIKECGILTAWFGVIEGDVTEKNFQSGKTMI